MENLKNNELEITFEAGQKNIIKWAGKSNAKDPSTLINPYFNKVINELHGKELEVQFENLQYMNSSTVPPIIELIKNLEQHGIKSMITYDKNSQWQAASFRALEVIAKSLEHITVIAR